MRLDPATQTLTGTEQITLHNNSPDALNQVRLRLDRQRDRRPQNPDQVLTPTARERLARVLQSDDAIERVTTTGGRTTVRALRPADPTCAD